MKGVVRLPASTAVQRVIVAHIRTDAGICKRRGTRLADGGRQAASFRGRAGFHIAADATTASGQSYGEKGHRFTKKWTRYQRTR